MLSSESEYKDYEIAQPATDEPQVQLTPEQVEAIKALADAFTEVMQRVADDISELVETLRKWINDHGEEIAEAMKVYGTGNNLISGGNTLKPEDEEEQPNDTL